MGRWPRPRRPCRNRSRIPDEKIRRELRDLPLWPDPIRIDPGADTMAIAEVDILVACNPATGAELGRVPATPPGEVAEAVARARQVQARWAETTWRERQAVLRRWWGVLARRADELAEVL